MDLIKVEVEPQPQEIRQPPVRRQNYFMVKRHFSFIICFFSVIGIVIIFVSLFVYKVANFDSYNLPLNRDILQDELLEKERQRVTDWDLTIEKDLTNREYREDLNVKQMVRRDLTILLLVLFLAYYQAIFQDSQKPEKNFTRNRW